ncbi:MAG: hypothetical protein WKF83_02780 [Nocardioidaceae bacterium]
MITAAVRAAATADRLSLAALELRLAAADLPGQVRQSAATCESLRRDGILDRDVMVFVEAPRRDPQRASQCDAALEAAAEAGVRLKFRTGGVAAEAFPSEQELAGAIVAAVARGVPFKCTAGLHNAARHRDAATGFEHHGFLNVLLATSLAVEGAATADLSAMLAEVDGTTLASQVRSAGTAALPMPATGSSPSAPAASPNPSPISPSWAFSPNPRRPRRHDDPPTPARDDLGRRSGRLVVRRRQPAVRRLLARRRERPRRCPHR